MKYNDLQVSANKNKKRVGRGIAAGQGKTAGHSTKDLSICILSTYHFFSSLCPQYTFIITYVV